MRRILLAALGPLALLTATLSLAQAPAATGGSGWERLGLDGILVRQVAVDRQDANTLHLILGEDTQVVSNDRGQTWRTVPSDLRPFYVQDPNRPQTYFRWAPPPVAGIERSQDDGQTWSLVWRSPKGSATNPGMGAPPGGVAVPSVVLAWAVTYTSGPISTFTLLRTLDGGESWSEVLFPGYNRSFVSAAFNVSGGISFLAAATDYVKCGSYLCVVPPALWKSADYFQADFTQLSLPSSVSDIRTMAFGQGQLLLVSRQQPLSQVVSNVWQSPDDGRTWFPLFASSLVYPQSPYLTSIAVWPGAPTRILLGTGDGLWVRDLPTIQHTYFPLVAAGFVGGW